MPKPDPNLPAMVVIFTNLSTMFTLAPELNAGVFNTEGIPYCPPNTPRDIEWMEETKIYCKEMVNQAIEEHYSIILINNTPLTYEVLKEFHDNPNYSNWLYLSFFHGDTELIDNKIPVTETEYLQPDIILDIKTKDLVRLQAYPYIKKVVIPYGFHITSKYLKSLFKKNNAS
jgi:hypothetical protein